MIPLALGLFLGHEVPREIELGSMGINLNMHSMEPARVVSLQANLKMEIISHPTQSGRVFDAGGRFPHASACIGHGIHGNPDSS